MILAPVVRALGLVGLGVALSWSCGAQNCLRDSDCDEGLVCSRESCVAPPRSAGDAGPSSAGSAGSAGNAGSAGSSGGSALRPSTGGSGGRPPLLSSSAGGSATGGRENLDASADADAASNRD